jgi:hypothetical protein
MLKKNRFQICLDFEFVNFEIVQILNLFKFEFVYILKKIRFQICLDFEFFLDFKFVWILNFCSNLKKKLDFDFLFIFQICLDFEFFFTF